jgi:beta-lactamase regulating signal transducer with metallopeptidase domain
MPGLLALQTLALIGLAALLQRLIKSVAWRRTLWQACMAGLVILVGLEISGVARTWTARLLRVLPEARRSALWGEAPISGLASAEFVPAAAPMAAPVPAPAPSPANELGSALATPSPTVETKAPASLLPRSPGDDAGRRLPWVLLLWIAGSAALLLRSCFAHFLFFILRRRGKVVRQLELNERVQFLSRQLGLRRSVRLIESPRLTGPIAFGVLHPGIGLPPSFATLHPPAEQDVMLAHELAHLTAGDPVWYRLADLAAALLWWHPGAWWARRQLHAASETAADEASLLLANGPGVLAECLVALGARLAQPRPAGWLGIEGNGFRSGLARRVQRLVDLRAEAWSPPGSRISAMARVFGPAALVLAVLLCTAWTFPKSSNHGATMKQWKQALTVLTLMTAFGIEQTTVAAEPPGKPSPKPNQNFGIALQAAGPQVTVDVRTDEVRPAEIKSSQSLRQKLEQIVIPEVMYDSLPLDEVVRSLIDQSTRLDSQKLGVNFLFGQKHEYLPTVDPATGLPMANPIPEIFDLRSVTVRIMPALKNVRLIDVLDAITKVADVPIQYSIGEYAVVFTRDLSRAGNPSTPQAAVLQTRTFKVNTNTFFASIERLLGRKLHPGSKSVGLELREVVFPRLGARVTSPDAVVLYNDLTGILLVQASAEELVAVQAAIETLGGAPSTSAAVKPSNSSLFLKHLAEGPHVHVHRAVTGVFNALGHLTPPPFKTSRR